MKMMRTVFLGLGLALVAGVSFADHAAAQCSGCGVSVERDEDGNIFTWTYCTFGLESGSDSCSTPAPTECDLGGACPAEIAVMLDGRAAPRQSPEYAALEALVDVGVPTAFSASYASLAPPSGFQDSAKTRRSCDGGIVSKSYLQSETSAIRSATAQLRV
ncbi:hypothetical protein [Candidatus Palauibacter sp.]|uniref:hypothetical protein n=1 Tax=Candidatus Palauibacter sp. TaxID=3101350 RepID=UPI003B01720D